MSFRTLLTTLTLMLLAFILYEARHTLTQALDLLGQVNIWALALVVPVVAVSFLSAGEMVFSYLRQKRLISHIPPTVLMRISLELNFVNHVLPSGGVSGVTYMNWRLGKLGVATSRATMAQAVRYVAGFAASSAMLLASLLLVTLDGTVNRWIILMSALLIIIMLLMTGGLFFAVSNRARITKIAHVITGIANYGVKKLSFGRVKNVLQAEKADKYFTDMHADYLELSHDKKLLLQPFWWGMLFVAMDIAMFWITFWALGTYVNPATILIAYSLASLAGFIVITPGGVGAYEAIMVTVIAMSGVAQADAIAGIILARTIILMVTIIGGYIFYQRALIKYGKTPKLDPAAER